MLFWIILAIVFGELAVFIGLVSAFYLNLAPGGTIVVTSIVILLLVIFIKKMMLKFSTRTEGEEA
mgnify:FL=1